MKLYDKPRPWILPKEYTSVFKTWNPAGTFQRIGEQLIGSYNMNLPKIIPDREIQIHMIIPGEFRIGEITATKDGEMIRVGHF